MDFYGGYVEYFGDRSLYTQAIYKYVVCVFFIYKVRQYL